MGEYERFLEITGLQISRRTFYRMKRELQSGEVNRLSNLVERKFTPPHEKKSFKKHGNPDEVPFLGYDGEGITLDGKHRYVLLASGNGESVYRPNGLSTVDCLDFLLRSRNTRRIRIFYSFGYDVQQILTDLTDEQVAAVMHGEIVRFRNYTLHYLPGKIFSVNNVRFYDVFNYWQKSFIKAVSETLGKDRIPHELVVGKENRSNFADWNLDDILHYTNIELELLQELAEHLRSILLRVDIHLGSAFYGPGSIANYWFKHHRISPPKITDPTLVDVMERAYFGGRFETFILGKSQPVYECDINSAYPAIIADLPYLDGWEKWSGGLLDRSSPYSVWHVSWNLRADTKIGPFPSRDKHGLISYPASGKGWYWKPEVEAAIALYGRNSFDVIEGYNPSIVEGTPFDWVNDVYNLRLELKAKNDPAQQGLKIGLNSLYGKTAQRIGSAKYFSLAWAGYITSATRAKLIRAVIGREESVIAFATDAVYFNSDPKISNSTTLGGWSAKRWNIGYFIQSGVYRLEGDKESKDAYRGFSVKNGIGDLLDQIRDNRFKHPSIYQIKFVGHLEAIRAPNKLGPYRLSFITVRKKLKPYQTTKRRVDYPNLWPVITIEDPEDVVDSIKVERGGDFYTDRTGSVFVWNDYGPLLTKPIETQILCNHNDHRDVIHPDEVGDIEESYPFRRITDRREDIGLTDSDDIAEERIGGANGLIPLSAVNKLPIVDEEDILKEIG